MRQLQGLASSASNIILALIGLLSSSICSVNMLNFEGLLSIFLLAKRNIVLHPYLLLCCYCSFPKYREKLHIRFFFCCKLFLFPLHYCFVSTFLVNIWFSLLVFYFGKLLIYVSSCQLPVSDFYLLFYTCKLKFACNFPYLKREDFQVVWNCSFIHVNIMRS